MPPKQQKASGSKVKEDKVRCKTSFTQIGALIGVNIVIDLWYEEREYLKPLPASSI